MNGRRHSATIQTCFWTSRPENRSRAKRAAVLVENTADSVARRRDGQRHRQLDRSLAAEGLAGRTDQLRRDGADIGFQPHELDGEVVALPRRKERVRRVEGRFADAPGDVGHAEAGEQAAAREGLRRERHGHPHHGRGPRGRHAPEGFAAPVVAHGRADGRHPGAHGGKRAGGRGRAEDDEDDERRPAASQEKEKRRQQEERERRRRGDLRVPAAEEKRLLRLFGDRERRDAVGRIALQEVEDLVAARIETRGERGPGDRRLRGNGGRERRVAAALAERRQVRQPPRRHHLLDDVRVHAVEAEDDDAGGLFRGAEGAREHARGQRREQDLSHPAQCNRSAPTLDSGLSTLD